MHCHWPAATEYCFWGFFIFIRNIQHLHGTSYSGCLDRSISYASPQRLEIDGGFNIMNLTHSHVRNRIIPK
nr:MAG TPA: hypothetical protein [Caudoviricetes sp.]